MGRYLRRSIISGREEASAMGEAEAMAMLPVPGAGGPRRRKLEESGEFQISYMQLRSRTLLRSPERKRRRRTSSSTAERSVSSGGDLECRNADLGRVLSRCSSDDMAGEAVAGAAGEALEEEYSRSGRPEGGDVEEMGTAASGCEDERRSRRREGTPASELRPRACDESGDLESTASPAAAASSNPGRRSVSGRETRTRPTPMPSEGEIDAFFSAAEKEHATRFAERYNYDVVKDAPLEGRYEWVRLKP